MRLLLFLVALAGWIPSPDQAAAAQAVDHSKSWAVVSGIAPEIDFDILTRADGVPQGEFRQILQDRRGFLWFTTVRGLIRYDGYQSVVYPGLPLTRIPPKTSAVPALLFEDKEGRIWAATNVLTRFDPAAGKFVETINPRPGPLRPGVDFITAIHDAPGDSLWVAVYSYSFDKVRPEDISDPILYEVNPARGTSIPHRIPDHITGGKPIAIRAIEEDTQGRVWLGTSKGLVRFEPAKGSFQLFEHNHPDPGVWQQKQFNALVPDKTGHLWVHMPAGLERFDPESGVFDRFIAARFWYLSPDPAGRFWLWGEFPGVKIFDPSAPAERALRTVEFTSPSGQRSQDVVMVSLQPDRRGNIWAYPAAGSVVLRYSPALVSFGRYQPGKGDSSGLESGLVLRVMQDHEGTIWILHNDGLNRYDPVTRKSTRVTKDASHPHGIDAAITSIYEDRTHTFWIGEENGSIGTFDPKTGRYTRIRKPSPINPITSLFEDRSGRFWVGAMLGPLYLADRNSAALSPQAIKGGYVTYEDHAGNLWFGASPGVNKLDPSGEVHMVPLRLPDAANPAPTVITAIHEDPDGTLWLSSNKGLHKLDTRTEKVTPFGKSEGLPTEDVRCMLSDGEGNLWLSTAEGISRFDPRERRFHHYDEGDGLQRGAFTNFSCYEARDGRLYFGGHNGFNAFLPREVLAQQREMPVALTGFQVGGKEQPVRGSGEISLGHKQNQVSVEFAVLNAVNPGRYRYRFRLEGLEDQWIGVDSEHRLARYTELRPGPYTFRAEASRDGNSWSSKGVELRLRILPPWWMTWWAETLAALAFAGLLLGIHRLRIATLRKQSERLEALVHQRTAELVQARDEAKAANNAKSVFLANMSHELRTPLNAILGFSNLLRRKENAPEQKAQLDIINRSGEHLLNLIDDVLDLAKIESGKENMAIASCDLHTLVADAAALVRMKADARGLEVICVPAPDLPRYVRVDSRKLWQVLINLLGNAVKYTEQGRVTLRVNAVRESGETVRLRFDVEDTGIGIAPEDRARIFEPFVQSSNSASANGTGLGLSISRRYVEMMRGTLGVESEVGRGSRFTLQIPVVELPKPDESQDGNSLDEGVVLDANHPECRILIVEDNRENGMLLSHLLSSAGFQVRTAVNGLLGVERFQQWKPHLIFMDLKMPVMGGAEATQQIRKHPGGCDVKIVAISASAFESEREEVLANGMDDFIRKPFRPREVLQCIARLLDIRCRGTATAPAVSGDNGRKMGLGSLTTITPGARERLAEALVSLDRDRISSAISLVGEQNEELASVLRRMHERFAYTALWDAVERAKSDAQNEGAPQ